MAPPSSRRRRRVGGPGVAPGVAPGALGLGRRREVANGNGLCGPDDCRPSPSKPFWETQMLRYWRPSASPDHRGQGWPRMMIGCWLCRGMAAHSGESAGQTWWHAVESRGASPNHRPRVGTRRHRAPPLWEAEETDRETSFQAAHRLLDCRVAQESLHSQMQGWRYAPHRPQVQAPLPDW